MRLGCLEDGHVCRNSLASSLKLPGPDKALFDKHPTLYFISVGLKYGPARGLLCDAAVAADLLTGKLTVAKLQTVLCSTAAKLHGKSMMEWVRRPRLVACGWWAPWALCVLWALGFWTLQALLHCWLVCSGSECSQFCFGLPAIAQDKNVGHGVQYHQGPILFLRRLGVIQKTSDSQGVNLGRAGHFPVCDGHACRCTYFNVCCVWCVVCACLCVYGVCV